MAVDQTDAEAAAAVCVADSQISAVSQHGDKRGTLDRLDALIVCIRLESAGAHSQATTLSPATPSEIAHAARLILQAMDAQRQETTTSQAADEGAVRGHRPTSGVPSLTRGFFSRPLSSRLLLRSMLRRAPLTSTRRS